VLRGDLLVAADGRVLDRIDALYEALDATGEQGGLELTIVRGTDERVVTVKV
jgi:S1-C subfamily serine protease